MYYNLMQIDCTHRIDNILLTMYELKSKITDNFTFHARGAP